MKTLTLLLTLTACAAAQTSIHVNVGGAQYTDSNGVVWNGDTGCSSAATYTRGGAIQGTADPTLYRTGRTDPSVIGCSYSVTNNAIYTVTLLFAETDPTVTKTPGIAGVKPRTMNVFVNNTLYATQLNVFNSSAFATAYQFTTPFLAVYGGNITIQVAQVAYQAMLSGIDIETVSQSLTPPPTPFVSSTTYNFTPQPMPAISIGSNTVTLIPCPIGVNGTDVKHTFWLTGGLGTSEFVTSTGGTCLSGAGLGTLTFTASSTHTGSTIQSATAGMYEALNSFPTSTYGGGNIYLPAGDVNMYGTLNWVKGRGVCITGQGLFSTTVQWLGGLIGDIFHFDGPDTAGGISLNPCVNNLLLQSPQANSSLNSLTGFNFDNAAGATVTNVSTAYISTGAKFSGATSQGNILNNFTVSSNHGDGILMTSPLVNAYLDRVNVFCDGTVTSNGLRITADAGSNISNFYSSVCNTNLLITPGTGQTVRLISFINSYFDCGFATGSHGVSINPTSTGIVSNIRFQTSTSACANLSGWFLGSTGTISDIRWNDSWSVISGHHGWEITGGQNLSFSETKGIDNGTSSVNAFDSINLSGTVRNVQIIGGSYNGDTLGIGSFTRYGINYGPGTTGLQIVGANLSVNNVAAINDTDFDTGQRTIHDNLGLSVASVASLAAFDPGPTDAEVISISGTTNVTSILHPWDQRTITFIKADGGSLTILGVPITTGGRVSCTYSTGFVGWFCK